MSLTLRVRILGLILLRRDNLSGKVADAAIDGNEVPLVEIDAAIKQLVHLRLNEIVHLILRVILHAELVTEFIDQQVLQLQTFLYLAHGELLLDGTLDLVHQLQRAALPYRR